MISAAPHNMAIKAAPFNKLAGKKKRKLKKAKRRKA